jgi:hypothetical protein
VLGDDLARRTPRAAARAADENALLAIGRARLGETGGAAFFGGDIHFAEGGADSSRDGLAQIAVQVENRDLGACGAQRLRGRAPEA